MYISKRSCMDHTVLSANTPCLPFLHKCSPYGATPNSGRRHPVAAYYSSINPKGMKGWVSLVGWRIAPWTVYLHKWSPISYMSSAGRKVCRPKTDVLPLCHATKCDKLLTDDGHQFTTLTVLLSRHHLKRSAVPEMIGAHKNFNGLRDLAMPLSGMVCHPSAWLALATVNLPTKFEVYLHLLWRYERRYKMLKWGRLVVRVSHSRSPELAPIDRAHTSSY